MTLRIFLFFSIVYFLYPVLWELMAGLSLRI